MTVGFQSGLNKIKRGALIKVNGVGEIEEHPPRRAPRRVQNLGTGVMGGVADAQYSHTLLA